MRLKRTTHRHWSPDPAYLQKLSQIEQIVRRAQTRDDTVVLYEDEAFAHLRPTLTRWYSQRGRAPRQLGTGTVEQTRCVFGAVNPLTGATYHLHRYNGAARFFVEFLDHLLMRHPRASSLNVIVDNWGVHASELTQRFLESHSRLHLYLLPTYAPWLNRQEKLWRAWRKHVTHGHPFNSMSELLEATDTFFDELRRHKAIVLRLIGQSGN